MRSAGALAIGLLGLMAALAGSSAWRESVTFDEVSHVGAAISYVQKLDLRMNEEHPPLTKILAGTAASIAGARADYQHISWEASQTAPNNELGQWVFGSYVLWRWNDGATVLRAARIPMLVLMLLLGWTIFRIGARLGGPDGGIFALAFYASAPLFLAMGPLVHTDVAAALFSLLTAWQAGEIWRTGARGAVWKLAGALAAAMLSKFNCLLLLPAMGVHFAWMALRPLRYGSEESVVTTLSALRRIGVAVAMALASAYTVYLVFSWNQDPAGVSSGGSWNIPFLSRLDLPLQLYWAGIAGVSAKLTRPVYALGQLYPQGVWFYFPELFLIKNTLPFLAACAAAAVVGISRLAGRRHSGEAKPPDGYAPHRRALWICALVLAASCLASQLNIGFRHFASVEALVILAVSALPRQLAGRRWAQPALFALAAASLICAIAVWPYYMPYLNVASSFRPGYWWTNDSNLDWNQSLPEIERFAAGKGLAKILVTESGVSPLKVYAPLGRLWNCQAADDTQAGAWAAISATEITFGHNCEWLMQYPHKELAGGSLYAVQLPNPIPKAGTPGGPPLPDAWLDWGARDQRDIRAEMVGLIERPEMLRELIR